ncbi:hypothetical protein [Sphaerisporangium fuscum]|uniref:hypothetical protein n=1 Tax=Sphaerisporangium fuscum TaxID=2835868 RepID=UPI001BDCF3B2|nr:hypothetical protein [Sphaerisporangium fuscum]
MARIYRLGLAAASAFLLVSAPAAAFAGDRADSRIDSWGDTTAANNFDPFAFAFNDGDNSTLNTNWVFANGDTDSEDDDTDTDDTVKD